MRNAGDGAVRSRPVRQATCITGKFPTALTAAFTRRSTKRESLKRTDRSRAMRRAAINVVMTRQQSALSANTPPTIRSHETVSA
jgi:hypothetical protein